MFACALPIAFASLGWLESKRGSHRVSESQRAEGRIVTRVRGAVANRYLNFAPRWTYWWVDKKGPGATWRSVFIPDSASLPRLVGELENAGRGGHPPVYFEHAKALFLPDGFIWYNRGGCCKARLR